MRSFRQQVAQDRRAEGAAHWELAKAMLNDARRAKRSGHREYVAFARTARAMARTALRKLRTPVPTH